MKLLTNRNLKIITKLIHTYLRSVLFYTAVGNTDNDQQGNRISNGNVGAEKNITYSLEGKM